MFRRGFLFRAFGTFLFLVLLVAGGYAVYRTGVNQGYALGVTTAASESGELPEGAPGQLMPYLYARPYGWYGPGFHPFGFFGLIFPLFFGLLFFFLITRLLFRPMLWGWGGSHRHWKHHGGAPPWAKDWEKADPKNDEKPDEPSGIE